MPILNPEEYPVPKMLFNRHLETIIPGIFRRVGGISFRRERIPTPDGDFLDLDWSENGNDRLVIVSHGLEGNSKRPYMKGMVKAFNQAG